MSRCRDSDIAPIGYKVQRGDYIEIVRTASVSDPPFIGGAHCLKVSKVTNSEAIVAVGGGGRRRRNSMRFPRIYSLPYRPFERYNKRFVRVPTVQYRVRINDSNFKKLRLRYE